MSGGGAEYHNFKVAFEIVNEEKTIFAQPEGRRRRGKPIETLTFSSKLVFDQDPLKLLCIGNKTEPVTQPATQQESSNVSDSEREYWAMDNAAKKTLGVVLLLRHPSFSHASEVEVPDAEARPVIPPIFIPVTTGVSRAQLQGDSGSL